jgi:hypothetical protein
MIEPKDLPALSREELLALVLVVNSWWLSSLDPMICPACKSESLMIWTTLAPKLTPFGARGCNANHINAPHNRLAMERSGIASPS